MVVVLSPHPPPDYRRSDHLPRLAEATVRPENVVFVLVATPVLVGGGSAASAVLGEGGGGIDVTGEEKKGRPKDVTALLPRIRLFCHSALFSEDPSNSSRNHLLIAFPIYSETPRGKGNSSLLRIVQMRHAPKESSVRFILYDT